MGLPLKLRRIVFKFLFLLFYHISLKHRMITISNLMRAFPEKDVTDLIVLAKGVYRHLGVVTAEMFEIPYLTQKKVYDFVDIEDPDNILNALGREPYLIFTGHLGNWELLAATLALLARPISVIYRPLDNSILENLVSWIRTSKGNRILPKDKAMRSILRDLHENKMVGMLIDQNVTWQEGVFVDFFSQPACTTDGLALIALHTDIPVIPVFMLRVPSGKYRLVVGSPVEIKKTGKKKEDVITNTEIFTGIIEEVVKKYPDQWLWIHQRWKTKKSQVQR
ncbi:MAG: lysophospholipid acyltransferase family protein [Syntrophales bacterium]|nr:lysophospholipid acyltransferase family protein [Syntrophales bacterium]